MLLRLLLLLTLLAAGTADAQTYKAKGILFKSPGPYSQQQLEDVAGMHAGIVFTAADLTAAAQRLSDTGYFDSVGAAGDGTNIIFDLKPTDPSTMLHIGFENFVWLTHDDIEAAIHTKSPLFMDYLPENSPIADVIDTALQQALTAKSITAKVAHDTVEPTLQHPERALEFSIVDPTITVANIKLAGVSPDLVPFVQKSVNTTAHTAYNEGLAGTLTSTRILSPLLDAGYAAAQIKNVTLSPGAAANGTIGVVISATLDAGDIYHVGSMAYTGSPLVTADAFAATQKLHPGDLVSRKLLLDTLAPLDLAYRQQGYMDVVVAALPSFDSVTHTVSYSISVVPGEQYRIHQVSAESLNAKQQADFDRAFIMKEGTLYNPEYAAHFLKSNTSLASFNGFVASYKAYADPNNHTVDLVLTFFPAAH